MYYEIGINTHFIGVLHPHKIIFKLHTDFVCLCLQSGFLVMIPDYFRGRSKVRHSALSVSCLWPLTFSGNNRRYGTLISCLWFMTPVLPETTIKRRHFRGTIQGWYYHFLFGVPDYFRGQSKYTHFLYMIPGYSLGRSKVRHSLFPKHDYIYFSTNNPRHGTLHLLVMTPFFFH